MKSAKKILLLVLSLVLLVGVFAFATLAEEETKVATVVYPDGSTETVAVGATIVPKEFTDGLYYGAGNTLYKDDATAGWAFTVDGAAVADLKVTAAMAGKQILASGADKVYYVTEEKISKDAPAVTVYHLVNDVDKYMSSYNTGDRGDGTNTGASSRDVLGNKATESIKIKLYADVVTPEFYMILMPTQRQSVGIPTYLDLNGHSVTNNKSGSTQELKGAKLYIYSTVPGAVWYQPNTTNAIYASDDGTLYLGNDSANNATYSDNITFIAKSFFHGHWGGGAYIFGGHFYQIPGASIHGATSISRRVEVVQNASFYAAAGASIFSDESTPEYYAVGNGGATIKNCKFYGTDASAVLTSTQKAVLKFENCTFYGIKGTLAGSGTGSVTAVSTEEGGTNTFLDPISYKTVAFYNGTTFNYYAETLEDAKAYVENHALCNNALIEVKEGNELYLAKPVYTVTYDENFNATVARAADSVRTKVYYTLTKSDGSVEYYTNAGDYQAKVQAYFGKWTGGTTLTLYADVKFTATGTVALVADGTKNAFFDLNGYTLTFSTNTNSLALDIHTGTFYCYSSTPGGKIYAPSAKQFTRSNSGGTGIFGERDINTTQYGKNLTVETTLFNTALYGSGIGIYGGTYIQRSNSQYNHFITVSRENGGTQSQFRHIRNATFILNKPNSFAIHWLHAGFQTIANCTFISNAPGTRVLGNATTDNSVPNSAPILANCDFVNILPVAELQNGKIPTYQNCRFSLNAASTDGFTVPAGDATELRYLARINVTDAITVGEDSYPVNYALVDSFLTVDWEDNTHPYWALGSTPVSDTSLEDIIEKQADGTYKVICDRFQAPVGVTEVTEALLGTTVSELATQAGREVVTAFSYQVAGGNTNYAPLLATPAENGAQFVSLLNNLSNVKIVMYTDIELASGVLFGTFQDTVDAKNNPIKKILTSGDVDWDLNGFTVTVAAGATPIPMANYGESEGAKTFNVLHFVSGATFKLYSSVPGGKYINKSTTPIFGALKYESNAASYILGTSDLAVNGGDNLTIDSKASILIGYENNASGPAGVLLGINGGTYVYHGGNAAFSCGGDVRVYNAKVATSGTAKAVFLCAYWGGKQSFRIENSTVVAANAVTVLVEQGFVDSIATGKPKVNPHTVAIKDVVFAGGSLKAGYQSGYCTFVFEGKNVASDAEGLAVLYTEAPAGMIAVYSSVNVGGVLGKIYDYYADPAVVTVRNDVLGTVELWLAGSQFISPEADTSANVAIIDGKYYYRPNPDWDAMIDGVVIALSDVCAAENAGKTVVLVVGGEAFPIIFTVTVNGITTYYYNEETAAADFKAALTPKSATTYEIKLYNTVELATDARIVIGKSGTTATYKIDLNGNTLRVNKTTTAKLGYAFVFTNSHGYIYSTVAGGVLDVGAAAKTIACCDGSGHGYLGEPVNDGSTTYGKNLTVLVDAVHPMMYSSGMVFNGGTYVQIDESVVDSVFDNTMFSYAPKIRNCTFIIKNSSVIMKGSYFNGAIENCNFICAKPATLFTAYTGKDTAATFKNCNFYNVIANAPAAAVTFENCNFNLATLDTLAGGYIAYTGTPVVVNVNGVDYTFGAAFLPAESVALVNWGFDITEYWAIGATATHANVVIDGVFGYAFADVLVGEGENTAKATLINYKPGTLQMSLTLQSKIGLNVFLTEALANATVKIGDKTYVLAELLAADGYYKLEEAIAPNAANGEILITVLLNGNTHVISVSVGAYAEALLADAQYADAHALAYAMVEYVRVMTEDAEFLANVEAPAGYTKQVLAPEASGNTLNLLESIAFQLDGTIAIAVKGKEAANGKVVTLTLANSVSKSATVQNDIAFFEGLYVNEFFGTMTIEVEGETYTYSLANYLNGLTEDADKAAVQALYNYAYYAEEYVNHLQSAN